MLISFALAALSGALYVFSFAPWDIHPLMWIAFVPLLIASDRNQKLKQGMRITLLSGFILSLCIAFGGFYWIVGASQEYGELPLWVSFLLMLAFAVTGQLQVPIYLWVREKLKFNSSVKGILLLGVLYAAIESLYPKLFLDTAGNAFYISSFIRQLADIGGPFTITVVVLWVNELLASSILQKNKRHALAALFICALAHGYGAMRIHQYRSLETEHTKDPTYKISLIQANIGDYLKVAAEHGAWDATLEVMGKYLKLSREAIQHESKPDGIVWAETAYPAIYTKPMSAVEQKMNQMMTDFVAPLKTDVIFGGYDSDFQGLEYNSIFFLHPKNKTREIYHKNFLLMFGETLPFADTFPAIKSLFPNMGFFGRGPGPEILEVKNAEGHPFQLAPSICYEALFPEYSMSGALLGADALLNITNDSWFGPHGEPYLHLALMESRAVETRLPLIRATNTGFSVILNPLGETIAKSELFTEATVRGEFSKRIMPESPYMVMARVFGVSWFTRLTQLIGLVIFLMNYSKTRKFFARIKFGK